MRVEVRAFSPEQGPGGEPSNPLERRLTQLTARVMRQQAQKTVLLFFHPEGIGHEPVVPHLVGGGIVLAHRLVPLIHQKDLITDIQMRQYS